MTKTDVVSISDIHMGDNSVACWYNNEFHDGYLKRILQYVIANASDIKEFVILGDLFDFWTYPPDVKPPTVGDIIAANTGTLADPGIFGLGNIFDTAVIALEGRVSYIVGNHDITLTQADLNEIPLSNNYTITKKADEFMMNETLFTHGHLYTIFNAPDPHNPLPLGHFVTRLIAYHVKQNYIANGKKAWQLGGNGAPAKLQLIFSPAFLPALKFVEKLFSTKPLDSTTVSAFVDMWVNVTGFPSTGKFKMATGPDMTITDVKTNYANLFSDWVAAHNKEYVRKSVYTDGAARSMSWFTQQAGLAKGAKLVVTGHTHWPTNGVAALVDDVNCGFECFSKPNADSEKYTFARIKNVDTTPVPEIYAIIAGPKNIGFSCQPAANIPKGDIDFKPLGGVLSPKDFSVFVRVINNSTKTLTPSSLTVKHGNWVLKPTAIAPNTINGFWIQDSLGLHGSDGSVVYSYGSDSFTLKVDCPLIASNSVQISGTAKSNVAYRARIGDGAWAVFGVTPPSGHPLGVEFTVT